MFFLLLTLDINKITVDNVICIVDRLTAVPATVFLGRNWYLVACVVCERGGGVLWIFHARTIPLKGDWGSAVDATDKKKRIPFRDVFQGWDDKQLWVGERHCGGGKRSMVCGDQ